MNSNANITDHSPWCALADRDRSHSSSEIACLHTSDRIGREQQLHLSATLCMLLLLVLPGCTLCQNVKRSVLTEPTRYSATADRWRSVRLYRTWADEAYARFCGCGDEVPFSESYEIGFKDGFVDFVYGGGSGEPPPVPPREFWDVRKRNPNGHACAADWFDGYRHGASIARDEGYRERALVPTSKLFDCSIETCERRPISPRELPAPELVPADRHFNPEWLEGESVPLGPLESTPESENLQQPQDLLPVTPEEEPSEQLLPEPVETTPELDTPTGDDLTIPSPQTMQEAPLLEPEASPMEPEQTPLGPEQSPPIQPEPSPEQQPAEDLDSLFGPKTSMRSSSVRSSSVAKTAKHKLERIDVQQARAAFASAIQRKQQVKTAYSNARPLRTNIQQASALETPQAASIPRSEDRSKDMFHRLSP